MSAASSQVRIDPDNTQRLIEYIDALEDSLEVAKARIANFERERVNVYAGIDRLNEANAALELNCQTEIAKRIEAFDALQRATRVRREIRLFGESRIDGFGAKFGAEYITLGGLGVGASYGSEGMVWAKVGFRLIRL